MAVGAVTTLARLAAARCRAAARWLAPAATLFALAGTLYGLTVTLRRAQAGDIAYHLGLLTMQVASAILLLGALRLRRGTPSRG